MARKDALRQLRAGTVINVTSKVQEKALGRALETVLRQLNVKFPGIVLQWERSWFLRTIVADLKDAFPGVDFFHHHDSSYMQPDGGVLYLLDREQGRHVVLIAEKKNQGTNDRRKKEGKRTQSKGNAIERLGKNVIGFRTALVRESIFPFVCFGDGCDFAPSSSILDRVATIAMFGKLNVEHLHNAGPNGVFNRGSFYFRESEWTEDEMAACCYAIAEKAVFYYFSKYGEAAFRASPAPGETEH